MLWFWFIHFSFVDVLSSLLYYCVRSCDLGSPEGLKSCTFVLFSLSDEEPACSKLKNFCITCFNTFLIILELWCCRL